MLYRTVARNRCGIPLSAVCPTNNPTPCGRKYSRTSGRVRCVLCVPFIRRGGWKNHDKKRGCKISRTRLVIAWQPRGSRIRGWVACLSEATECVTNVGLAVIKRPRWTTARCWKVRILKQTELRSIFQQTNSNSDNKRARQHSNTKNTAAAQHTARRR